MAIPDLDVKAVRDGYIVRSGSVDDALTRAAFDVVRLMRELEQARSCVSRGFARKVEPCAAPAILAQEDDPTSDARICTGRESHV